MRALLVLVMLVVGGQVALAGPGKRHAPESAPETAIPDVLARLRQARVATNALQDKLRLSTAQLMAFKACTVAEVRDLSRATTAAHIARAKRRHMLAAGRIFNAWQFQQYLDVRHDFAERLLFAEEM